MAREVVVDVGMVDAPDLATVDVLARLQLAAGRAGARLRLRDASEELRALIRLAGLSGVLSVEEGGEPEPREELGVEEVVDVRDAAT